MARKKAAKETAKWFATNYGPYALALLLALIISVAVKHVCIVSGSSMYPTLINNEYITYKKEPVYQVGDIIVFKTSRGTRLVKRIIAAPGDSLVVSDGMLTINGLKYDITRYAENVGEPDYGVLSTPLTLKDDEYFVVGDNYSESVDSREFGPIQKSRILGKVKQ